MVVTVTVILVMIVVTLLVLMMMVLMMMMTMVVVVMMVMVMVITMVAMVMMMINTDNLMIERIIILNVFYISWEYFLKPLSDSAVCFSIDMIVEKTPSVTWQTKA